MLSHIPGTVSQQLQGVLPTVIFSPRPTIGPGLCHISQADGQEGHLSRSVQLESAYRVLGRIAEVCWPPVFKAQGEGRGRLGLGGARRLPVCQAHIRG